MLSLWGCFWVQLLTVTTVWNTGETDDVYLDLETRFSKFINWNKKVVYFSCQQQKVINSFLDSHHLQVGLTFAYQILLLLNYISIIKFYYQHLKGKWKFSFLLFWVELFWKGTFKIVLYRSN